MVDCRAESQPPNRSISAVFEGQGLHVTLLAILVAVTLSVAYSFGCFREGDWLGLRTDTWMYAALVLPVVHQLWVWFWWRMEYHLNWCSRTFGARAFRIYATGFAILAFFRIFTVIGLGVANHGTVPIQSTVAWTVFGLFVPLVVWLVYSVGRYFGFAHAVGADHFFEEHRTGDLCREGIFRYMPNAMYTVGFLVLWAPAVASASKAALLLAAFNHAYIWVHFY